MKSSRSMRIHLGLRTPPPGAEIANEKISGLDQKNRCCVYFCVLKIPKAWMGPALLRLNQSEPISCHSTGLEGHKRDLVDVVLAGGPLVEFSGEIAHLRTQKLKCLTVQRDFESSCACQHFFVRLPEQILELSAEERQNSECLVGW